jgi:hypothetical protein
MNPFLYRLCRQHDTYYIHACPACFLEYYRQRERQTGEAEVVDLRAVAYLAHTSYPMVP